MTGLAEIMGNASAQAGRLTEGVTFYTDEEGLKHCRKCKRKIETIVNVPGLGIRDVKVNCICDCVAAEREKMRREIDQAEQEMKRREQEREAHGSAKGHLAMTFAQDDSPNSDTSKVMRRWAKNFSRNIRWLFIYGGTGVGKTYYAMCAANALIAKGLTVRTATLADIEAELWDAKEKGEVYRELAECDCLVLDDFGNDRKTDHSYEVLYKIVDDRYKAGAPMIITTNLTEVEFADPQDIRFRRIMSRLWDKCYPVKMVGQDRRKGKEWEVSTTQGKQSAPTGTPTTAGKRPGGATSST